VYDIAGQGRKENEKGRKTHLFGVSILLKEQHG